MDKRPDMKPEKVQMSNRERLDRSTRGGASGIRYSRYSSDAESQSENDDARSDSDRRSESSSEEVMKRKSHIEKLPK